MADDRSPAEIEREVEIERAQLRRNIEQIEDRMRPGALFEEAISFVKDRGGSDFAASMGREMRHNPLPVLMIGAGLVWLAAGAARRETPMRGYRYDPRARRAAYEGGDPYAGGRRDSGAVHVEGEGDAHRMDRPPAGLTAAAPAAATTPIDAGSEGGVRTGVGPAPTRTD